MAFPLVQLAWQLFEELSAKAKFPTSGYRYFRRVCVSLIFAAVVGVVYAAMLTPGVQAQDPDTPTPTPIPPTSTPIPAPGVESVVDLTLVGAAGVPVRVNVFGLDAETDHRLVLKLQDGDAAFTWAAGECGADQVDSVTSAPFYHVDQASFGAHLHPCSDVREDAEDAVLWDILQRVPGPPAPGELWPTHKPDGFAGFASTVFYRPIPLGTPTPTPLPAGVSVPVSLELQRAGDAVEALSGVPPGTGLALLVATFSIICAGITHKATNGNTQAALLVGLLVVVAGAAVAMTTG